MHFFVKINLKKNNGSRDAWPKLLKKKKNKKSGDHSQQWQFVQRRQLKMKTFHKQLIHLLGQVTFVLRRLTISHQGRHHRTYSNCFQVHHTFWNCCFLPWDQYFSTASKLRFASQMWIKNVFKIKTLALKGVWQDNYLFLFLF